MIKIDEPIFITGHTRSGTNLLLRLIDGAEGLVVPPGEGKMNILRRFTHLNAHQDITANIELNIDEVINDELFSNTTSSDPSIFRNGIFSLVNHLYGSIASFKNQNIHSKGRWIEKNHNLEFYFARSNLFFGKIKMIYVSRNPLDNWLSWKKYAKKHNLDLNKTQLFINVINHVINEIKEHQIGLNQFSDLNQIFKHYSLKPNCHPEVLDYLFNFDSALNNNDPMYFFAEDISMFDLKPEQCFIRNYLYMHSKAKYLADQYPDKFKIIKYESLVKDTESLMIEISKFCKYEHTDVNLRPTDGGLEWRGNTSHDELNDSNNGITSNSINLWKDYLHEDEVNNINDFIAMEDSKTNAG